MDERKQLFVKTLANYLVRDQASMSIRLEMKDPAAQQWATLRGTTPLFGYPTLEEGTKQLAAWLGIEMDDEPKRKAKKGR